jgi:hypothetical protein
VIVLVHLLFQLLHPVGRKLEPGKAPDGRAKKRKRGHDDVRPYQSFIPLLPLFYLQYSKAGRFMRAPPHFWSSLPHTAVHILLLLQPIHDACRLSSASLESHFHIHLIFIPMILSHVFYVWQRPLTIAVWSPVLAPLQLSVLISIYFEISIFSISPVFRFT